MKVLQHFQKFRVLWHGRTELPEVPGRYKHAVPVPRVSVAPAYRNSRSSWYGYECPTEVTEILCRVTPGVNTPGVALCVPYRQNEKRKFGYGYECTELTVVPGTGRVVQNSQKSRVRVFPGQIPASKGPKKQQIDWSKKEKMNGERISNYCDWHTAYTDALIENNTYVYY